MSIPYLFSRPSGYVVRFLVPKAHQLVVGRRFVVRSLQTSDMDHARLRAAILAVQLTKFSTHLEKAALWQTIKIVQVRCLSCET
jgi:hypothetical protein